jgi:hypothetical protein
LILSFGPSYLASSSIILSYDTNTFVQVPFNFDLSSPYNFEWTVHNDFSTEVRLWTTSQSRPVLASASSGALNVTLRADSHLGVLASGGAGCCAYPGYDLRFDNIAVVDTTPSASLLFRSNDPLSKEGTWGFGANPAKLPGIDADAVLIPGFDHVGLNVGERVYESHPGYGAGTYTDATGTESVNVRFVGGVQQQHSKGTFLNDAEIGASSPVEATDEIPIFYGIAEKMATFIEAQEGKPFLSISKSGLVAVHENPFDLAALSSSQQKGGTGSYTNVGLLERAAEQAGANGGQGFIPDVLEENDLVPLLSPALLHYALTHTAQMEAVLQNGSFLSGFFDPVDFILTDPEGRRIGHTGALGTLNEIPDAYYSGDGGIEMFFLPEVVAGDYTLELFSLGFEYFAGIGGQSGTIFSDRRFIEKGTTFLTTFRAVPIPTPIPAPLALLLSGLTCLGLSYRHRFASVASPLRAW